MEWTTILKMLIDYGMLGLIAYFFFKDVRGTTKENAKVNKEVLNVSEELLGIIKEIKTNDIKSLEKMTELDNRFQIAILQITESIYDQKMIGNGTFQMFSDALNSKASYKNVVQVMEEIDENGLDDENRLNMLKENIVSIVSKGYEDMKKDILQMSYSKAKLDNFEHSFNILFADFIQDLKEILNPITYQDLKYDNNYMIFKQKIRNRIWKFSMDLSGMIKNIVKKY